MAEMTNLEVSLARDHERSMRAFLDDLYRTSPQLLADSQGNVLRAVAAEIARLESAVAKRAAELEAKLSERFSIPLPEAS